MACFCRSHALRPAKMHRIDTHDAECASACATAASAGPSATRTSGSRPTRRREFALAPVTEPAGKLALPSDRRRVAMGIDRPRTLKDDAPDEIEQPTRAAVDEAPAAAAERAVERRRRSCAISTRAAATRPTLLPAAALAARLNASAAASFWPCRERAGCPAHNGHRQASAQRRSRHGRRRSRPQPVPTSRTPARAGSARSQAWDRDGSPSPGCRPPREAIRCQAAPPRTLDARLHYPARAASLRGTAEPHLQRSPRHIADAPPPETYCHGGRLSGRSCRLLGQGCGRRPNGALTDCAVDRRAAVNYAPLRGQRSQRGLCGRRLQPRPDSAALLVFHPAAARTEIVPPWMDEIAVRRPWSIHRYPNPRTQI